MEHLQTVFFGVTPVDVLLGAGWAALIVASIALIAKHTAWFARGYYRQRERRRMSTFRAVTELAISCVIAAIYIAHGIENGLTIAMDPWNMALIRWAVAILLLILVMTRSEEYPPPRPV